MNKSQVQKSGPFLSKRRLGLAGVAAFIGCAACCAIPFVAAGLGSGAVATLSSVIRPGSELLVGGTVFVATLGLMAVRNRLKRGEGSACGTSCKVDGTCCGAAARSA